MNIKKLLLTSTIIVIFVFGLMMLTSYAWYSLSGGSTAFDTNTYNEYIDIKYETSEYINVGNAIPISDSDVDSLASANKFSVNTISDRDVSEVLLNISLVNIEIDDSLKNSDFKYELLHNDEVISKGNGLDINGDELELNNKDVIYSDIDNNYVFRVWISDNDLEQNNMQNSTFKASIKVNAVKIRSSSKKNITMKDLFEDGSEIKKVHIGGDNNNPEVELNDTQKIMKDNNGDYRYYGKNPNNWVNFNGEKWRIISYSKVYASESDKTGSMRLKLIRPTSVGKYSYDSSESGVNSGLGVNDWSKSDLMTELNNYYLNSTSGTCYNGNSNASTTCNFSSIGLKDSGRDLIDNALYYLGGSSTNSGLYADDYYNFERGSTVPYGNATKWVGMVGIMYPSDYVYAADLSVCNKDAFHYGQDTTNCTGTDWLFLGADELTIAPYSGHASYVFRVDSPGYVYYGNYSFPAGEVRPVVYLKSGVSIMSGAGTQSNPYNFAYLRTVLNKPSIYKGLE